MSLATAVQRADALLPGVPAPEGEEDPRWAAIIEISEFIPVDPDPIWSFVARWGGHPDEDLRAAIATCLLEHLLEHHFDLIFPRVEHLARSNRFFAETVGMCWKMGQTELPNNSRRFDRLLKDLRI